jgi:serine/threonine-protein kinase
MSAPQALDLFTGGLDAVPLVGEIVALLAVAGYLVWIVPRLPQQASVLISVALAASLSIVSGLLLSTASIAWPSWPAVIALLFGHVGIAASRPAVSPKKLPHQSTTAAPRHAPAAKPLDTASANSTAPDRSTLGRYRIDRQLGRGAMGAVYLGHDPKIGRQVAIKTMALSHEFDGAELTEARARFFREAETAGRLQHRDIVTIFDAGEDQGLAYIAMEYLKGHDMQRYTNASGLLPLSAVLNIGARVADALAYAHNHGVVHRDIKPANVMVDLAVNSVKVTDFGIARITDASRTRTGMVLGTPSYMSPEQMSGRRVDGRSDLYSLGVMLFQLITGRLPHQADSMAKLMYQIANDSAPDIRTLRPDLPQTLADVVALALEKRVEVRYADGRQLAADLRTVAADCPAEAQPALTQDAARPPESDGFAATVKFSRPDPGHNSPP